MIKYLKGILIITVAFTAMYLAKDYLPWKMHPNFPSIIIFFFFQSLVISIFITFGEKLKDQFAFVALGAVVLRLLSAIFFLGWQYFANVDNVGLFAAQLIMVYLSYMAFELSVVLTNLRQN